MNNCQPPLPTTDQPREIEAASFWVKGTLIEKNPDLLKLVYQDSNKFWDESDLFSLRGEPVQLYRLAGDERLEVGDQVLVRTNKVFWDERYFQQLDECAWSPRVFQAETIEVGGTKLSIQLVAFSQSLLASYEKLLYLAGGLCILLLSYLVLKRNHSR